MISCCRAGFFSHVVIKATRFVFGGTRSIEEGQSRWETEGQKDTQFVNNGYDQCWERDSTSLTLHLLTPESHEKHLYINTRLLEAAPHMWLTYRGTCVVFFKLIKAPLGFYPSLMSHSRVGCYHLHRNKEPLHTLVFEVWSLWRKSPS